MRDLSSLTKENVPPAVEVRSQPLDHQGSSNSQLFFFFFFFNLFMFWLLWVFLAVHGLLIAVASLVAEHGI